jgi:RNA ligase
MSYEFPTIRTIEDVLPHIEGYNEFIVAERDFGTVIDYTVAFEETFARGADDELGWKIRRECRGLKFDKDGKLIGRPLHKFFNLGEKEETRVENLDFSKPHRILDKLDGSMIHPIMHEGEIRFCTKMGMTEIADAALEWVKETYEIPFDIWARMLYGMGLTPIFEWCSPANRVVIDYGDTPKFTLLAIRVNLTGEYLPLESVTAKMSPVPIVESRNVESTADFLNAVSAMRDIEGFIVAFENGTRVKIKTDEYVQLHRVVDETSVARSVAALVLDGGLDDTLAKVPPKRAEAIRAYATLLHDAIYDISAKLETWVREAVEEYGEDRKSIATKYVNEKVDPNLKPMFFRYLDLSKEGATAFDVVTTFLKTKTTRNVNWEAAEKMIGLDVEYYG